MHEEDDSPAFPTLQKKVKPKVVVDSLTFDSNEELYWYWMLQELQRAGIVSSIVRSETYTLSPAVKIATTKGNGKPKDRELLKGHVYTPDLTCTWVWDHPAIPLLVRLPGSIGPLVPFTASISEGEDYISVFEVKPVYDQNGKTAFAQVNRKWMYEKYKIFVNLVKIDNSNKSIFAKLWTPRRYLMTNVSGKGRSLHHSIISLESWLEAAAKG